MLTHGNLRSNARVLQDYWGWQQGDVLMHALPIFHVHGLFVAIHGALHQRQQDDLALAFDPALVVSRLPEATVFMGVPTLYVRMLAEPGLTPAPDRQMRLFISGSAPLLIETFDDWKVRTGHTILERYGMSETVMLTSNPCGPDARHGDATERRGGTVGFPVAGRLAAGGGRCGSGGCHRRGGRHSGARPQCVQGLLAHAGEDRRGVHRRRLLQNRRRRPG